MNMTKHDENTNSCNIIKKYKLLINIKTLIKSLAVSGLYAELLLRER